MMLIVAYSSTCRKRLWNSEFQAPADGSAEAERLLSERKRRTHCTCDPVARAVADLLVIDTGITDSPRFLFADNKNSDDEGNMELFSDLLCEEVIPDLAKSVRAKKPDRVIGLARTDILKQLTLGRKDEGDDLRHSPFRAGHVLYPFLILEAKNDKNGSGAQHIKRQTAFPIRTLVKLQQNLSSQSENGLDSLVWFLANRGEVWRVSACIMDGSELVCCPARTPCQIQLKHADNL